MIVNRKLVFFSSVKFLIFNAFINKHYSFIESHWKQTLIFFSLKCPTSLYILYEKKLHLPNLIYIYIYIYSSILCILSAKLPAVSITPDHRTVPSVTASSWLIPEIIDYQPLPSPAGFTFSSSVSEQRSTARHNWSWYRSPMAAILQFPQHQLHLFLTSFWWVT